jgi:hypothetical protein
VTRRFCKFLRIAAIPILMEIQGLGMRSCSFVIQGAQRYIVPFVLEMKQSL